MRPKLSSYFSHYIPSAAAHTKPEHLAPARASYVRPRSVGAVPSIDTQFYQPDIDQLVNSVMSTLLVSPRTPLGPKHNSSLLLIMEAWRDLRDDNVRLRDRLSEETDAKYAALLEVDHAEKRWKAEEDMYKAEVKRLELLIANSKKGLAGVMQARQASVLRQGTRKSRKHDNDDDDDDRETVFEFLERTNQEDKTARKEQRGRLAVTLTFAHLLSDHSHTTSKACLSIRPYESIVTQNVHHQHPCGSAFWNSR